MKGLVFYSSKNSRGKVDATGVFIPEAKKFAGFHGIPEEDVIGIDCTNTNSSKNRVATVIRELKSRGDLEILAFFGHGWPSGIQFGFKSDDVGLLVRNIRAKPNLKVGILACLTAENKVRDTETMAEELGPATNGGFADLFRDEMVRHGIDKGWVDGHKTRGHATWNPYVVRFLCEDVCEPELGGFGGFWIVDPQSAYWKRWGELLRRTDLRYGFVTMTRSGIKEILDEPFIG